MAKILLIDDDRMICDILSLRIRRMGHETCFACTLEDGLKQLSNAFFDLVFLDVNMPDGNGLDVLPKIRESASSPEVIIITGLGDPDGAELAIRSGAWDYVQKGDSIKSITLPLMRALQYREERLRKKISSDLIREGIIGESSSLMSCLDLVAVAANSDTNVLLTGETGTGKELFAWAIHRNSTRSEKNFVVIDCAALPDSLVESMLFGHEKGAFTGADRSKDGLILQADKGTLFLDEVGELPLSLQKAFLRVLQEHRFRPVGSKDEIRSDFRLVAATNRDLEKMVRQGSFREDLLFRLRSFTIHLPPLRERPEDLKKIVIDHLSKLSQRYAIAEKNISPGFFSALDSYHWPGNIRELKNALDYAFFDARNDSILFEQHLPTEIRIQIARDSVQSPPIDNSSIRSTSIELSCKDVFPSLKEYREESDREYLESLLQKTQGDMKTACSISGLSISRLYALLKKHNIEKR